MKWQPLPSEKGRIELLVLHGHRIPPFACPRVEEIGYITSRSNFYKITPKIQIVRKQFYVSVPFYLVCDNEKDPSFLILIRYSYLFPVKYPQVYKEEVSPSGDKET